MTTRKSEIPNRQKEISQLLGGDPILFHPGLVKVAGSVSGALILAQILFWQGLGKWGSWVYKTIEELEEETGLSRSQQDTAIKAMVSKGILKIRRAGAFGKRHFTVDLVRLTGMILGMQESGILPRRKSTISFVRNQQTITETTSETTSDINRTGIKKLEQLKQEHPVRGI